MHLFITISWLIKLKNSYGIPLYRKFNSTCSNWKNVQRTYNKNGFLLNLTWSTRMPNPSQRNKGYADEYEIMPTGTMKGRAQSSFPYLGHNRVLFFLFYSPSRAFVRTECAKAFNNWSFVNTFKWRSGRTYEEVGG